MSTRLTVLCHNFENNGGGDANTRHRAAELWATLSPQLVLRQEMWDAAGHGNTVFYEQESRLGLRGWLGQRSCTAIFADPTVFAPVREWDFAPVWKLPPTAVSLRVLSAGPAAIPLNAACTTSITARPQDGWRRQRRSADGRTSDGLPRRALWSGCPRS